MKITCPDCDGGGCKECNDTGAVEAKEITLQEYLSIPGEVEFSHETKS